MFIWVKFIFYSNKHRKLSKINTKHHLTLYSGLVASRWQSTLAPMLGRSIWRKPLGLDLLHGVAFTIWDAFPSDVKNDYKKAKVELSKIFSRRDEVISFQRMISARPRQPGEPLQVYKSDFSHAPLISVMLHWLQSCSIDFSPLKSVEHDWNQWSMTEVSRAWLKSLEHDWNQWSMTEVSGA